MRRLGSLVRFLTAVQERRRFGGERLLRVVDLGALQCFEACDFIEREIGEYLEEAADVRVFCIAPVLPVFVWALHVGVEPDGAVSGLAHLGAGSSRDQRLGEAVEAKALHAAA